MINKLKRLYPDYIIIIKKDDKYFDLSGNIIKDFRKYRTKKYIIASNNTYEVHYKAPKNSILKKK